MAYHPFRNFGLKFLSLGIALLLWLSISGEQVVERSLRAPLELQNIPEQLEVLGDPPGTVDIRVKGSSAALTRLGPSDVVAFLELGSARPGRRLFHLLPEHVRVPYGVEVAHLSPSTIPITFERSGSRTIPVVPQVEGEPAEGYMQAQVTADPPMVEVVGPENLLNRLTEVITEPVSVSGAAGIVQELVTIGVGDPALRLKSPGSALVTVNIVPVPIELTVQKVPVQVRNVTSGRSARCRPDVVAVLLKGNRGFLEEVTVESLDVHVDIVGLGPGRYNLPVMIEPVAGVTVLGTEPATVSVLIR
jgi:hypothetical protein